MITINEYDRLELKEVIAEILFYRDWEEPEQRPSEETCHKIADDILEAMLEDVSTTVLLLLRNILKGL